MSGRPPKSSNRSILFGLILLLCLAVFSGIFVFIFLQNPEPSSPAAAMQTGYTVVNKSNNIATIKLENNRTVLVQNDVLAKIEKNESVQVIVESGDASTSLAPSDQPVLVQTIDSTTIETVLPAENTTKTSSSSSSGGSSSGSTTVYIDLPVYASTSETIPLIQADLARETFNISGEGYAICLLDSGVNASAIPYAKVVSGYDYINWDSDTSDDNGHGTYLASVISKVAPNVTIISVKVLDSTGAGHASNVINGINYCKRHAAEYNIKAMSMSLGGGRYSGYCVLDPLANSVKLAHDQGYTMIASSGNNASSYMTSPACVREAIAVASSSKSDIVSSFSNMNGMVDLLAPGESVTADGLYGPQTKSGTSISVAHVAGATALLLETNSSMTPDEIDSRFKNTGKLIEYNGANYSRLDVFSVIMNIRNAGPTDQDINDSNETNDDNYTAAVDVSACGNITTNGSYVMSTDLIGAPTYVSLLSSNACILVLADNVTLDCNGHSVTNNVTGSTIGIGIGNNRNVTVKNCPSISNYSYGVYTYHSLNSIITNVTTYSVSYGIYLNEQGSGNNTVMNSRASGGSYGIMVGGEGNDTIYNNTANGSGFYGIYISYSSYNNISKNTVYNGVQNGFFFDHAGRNSVTENIAHSNGQNGFQIMYSSANNTFTNNTAYNNTRSGFYLNYTTNNTFSRNRAYLNSQNGFIIEDYSPQNMFESNLAYTNTIAGIMTNYSNAITASIFINNTAYNNSYGIFLKGSQYNNLTNNTVYNNTFGYLLTSSNYNNLTNNFAYNNTRGYYLNLSHHSVLSGGYSVNNTQAGFMNGDSINTSLENITFYGNKYGFIANNSLGIDTSYLMINCIFKDTAAQTNLSKISANDTVSPNEIYAMNWSYGTVVPDDHVTVLSKRINLTDLNYALEHASIDRLTMAWDNSELSGFNEPDFQLYKINSSITFLLNYTPNTASNELSTYDVQNLTEYGIFQDLNCRAIEANDTTYSMDRNFVGTGRAGLGSAIACVRITGSNVTFDCNGHNITDDGAAGTHYGIYVGDASNVTVRNCGNISSYDYGVYLNNAVNNTIRNITVSTPGASGFELLNSDLNNLLYLNSSTYSASGTGIELVGSDGNTIQQSSFHNSRTGVRVYSSSVSNNFFSNYVYGNSEEGFVMDSTYNTMNGNTVYSNTNYGFFISSNSGSLNVFSNDVYFNKYGIFLNGSSSDKVGSNTIHQNSIAGLYILDSNLTNLTFNKLYNNSVDFKLNNTLASSVILNMSWSAFLNPAGTLFNYTNMSINDNVAAGSAYTINWTMNSSANPGHHSLANKFVNMEGVTGSVSLDQAIFYWTSAEETESGLDPNTFAVWEYSSSWSQKSGTLDTVNRKITVANLVPASDYGIMDGGGVSECTNITSSGSYSQGSNITGAPINVTDVMNVFPSYSCIVIKASDVIYNCNGFSLIGNSSSDYAVGLLIWDNVTNVTVRNCTAQNYSIGFSANRNNLTIFDSNTAFNNSGDGFDIYANVNLTMVGNDAHNNSDSGFLISGGERSTMYNSGDTYSAPFNTNLTDNNAYDNGDSGFVLTRLSYNYIYSNNANRNGQYGFQLSSYTHLSDIISNRANQNHYSGIYIYPDSGMLAAESYISNNNLTDNQVHDNWQYGIYLSSKGDTTATVRFIRNLVYNNTNDGIYILPANSYAVNLGMVNIFDTSVIALNNTVYNNSNGISLGRVTYNLVANNTVYRNSNSGIALGYCAYDIIQNNSVFNNTVYGIDLGGADHYLDVLNNYVYNNLDSGIYIQPTTSMLNPYGLTNTNVTANTVYRNGQYGLEITPNDDSANQTNLTIMNNVVYNNTNDGIYAVMSFSGAESLCGGGTYNLAYRVLNNTVFNNSQNGINVYHGTNNLIANNTAYGNHVDGISLNFLTYNIIQNNTAYNNSENGIYFDHRVLYDDFINNRAYLNGKSGLYLEPAGMLDQCPYQPMNVTGNIFHSNKEYGVSLSSNNDTPQQMNVSISDNIAYNNTLTGFYLRSDTDTMCLSGSVCYFNMAFILRNNSAYNNSQDGFYMFHTTYNVLASNSAYNNSRNGFLLPTDTNFNAISNNTAYDNLLSGFNITSYYNTLRNNTAFRNRGSGFETYFGGFGGYMFPNYFFDNAASNNSNHGFHMSSDKDSKTLSNVTYTNNTASNNSLDGFNLASEVYVSYIGGSVHVYNTSFILSNNSAYNNLGSGINVFAASNNILYGNLAYNNTIRGFELYYMNINTLTNNTAYKNGVAGLYLGDFDNALIESSFMYGNGRDLIVNSTLQNGEAFSINLSHAIFTNPSGSMVNYTNLSVYDIVANNTGYSINYTQNTTPNTGYKSFGNKFVNISTMKNSVSLDNVTWTWLASEESGYTPSSFTLWEYSAGTWTQKTAAVLDTGNRNIRLESLVPASDYGIMDGGGPTYTDIDSCRNITSSGLYALNTSLYGYPNAGTCIRITATDVVLDCRNYNFTGNDLSMSMSAILVTTTNNVTVRNCNITNYSGLGSTAIKMLNSSNCLIENNRAYNNGYGITLDSYYSSDKAKYNTIRNNTACNNGDGIEMSGNNLSYNNITGNYLCMNSRYGIQIYTSTFNSYYNNFVNNTAFNNSNAGFYITEGDNSLFLNNNATLNNNYGFYFTSVDYLNLTSNFASYTRGIGDGYKFDLASSSYQYLFNNTAYNNTGTGFSQVSYGSPPNMNMLFVNNTANNNYYGFSLGNINNTLYNNTANNNTIYGIAMWYAGGNTFVNNTAQENGRLDFLVFPDSTDDCADLIEGNTGSGGRAIVFLNSSVNYADRAISELILCNADYANVTNVTVLGSDVIRNNGIVLTATDHASVTNSSSMSNYYGIDMGLTGYQPSSNNTISWSNFTNNTYGINVVTSGSSDNSFNSNIMDLNDYGVVINQTGSSNAFDNNTIKSNAIAGIYFRGTATFSRDRLFNNTRDFWMVNLGAAETFNLVNVVFDNPSDSYANFTNLSAYYSSSSSGQFILNWTARPATLPANRVSVNDKYLRLTTLSGTPSINNMTFYWNDTEAGAPFNETSFLLYSYVSSWADTGATLNTAANSLNLSSVTGSKVFALFNSTESPPCRIINKYRYDFEDNDGAFTSYTQSGFGGSGGWSWGAPDNGPYSAHSGSNVWSTGLHSNIDWYSNYSLASATFDLSTAESPVNMTFYHWYNTWTGYYGHGGNVQVSTDGGSTWALLTPMDSSYPDTCGGGNYAIPGEPCYAGYSDWTKATFNMTPYAGQSDVKVRWLFGGYYPYVSGWSVDDVIIRGCDQPSESNAPVVTLNGPPEGETITIPGSLFNFTVVDDTSKYMDCYMYINGTEFYHNDSVLNNTKISVSSNGIALGDHNWQVNCTDDNSNMGASEIRNFTWDVHNCPILNTTGEIHVMPNNYIGAPNDASESGSLSYACIKVAAPDVVVDCNGSTIINDVVTSAAGIFLNGSAYNVTIKNCPNISKYYDAVFLSYSNNNTIYNLTVDGNQDDSGIYLSSSNGNNLTDITVSNNNNGIYIYDSILNTMSDIIFQGNSNNGLYSFSSNDNQYRNLTVNGSGTYGIYLSYSNGANISDTVVSSTGSTGFYLVQSDDAKIERVHFFSNWYDFYPREWDSTGINFNMSDAIFDNPEGNYTNYTNVSIVDTMTAERYRLAWTSAPSPDAPLGTVPFHFKYLNYFPQGSSVDTFTWHYLDSEITDGGFNESALFLATFTGTNWATGLGEVLNTTTNTLALSSVATTGTYGLFNGTPSDNCKYLNTQGQVYTMQNNFTGAPYGADEIGLDYFACVKIAASDVVFDCNGSTIDYGYYPPDWTSFGIAILPSATNVTIRNCPSITNYTVGVIASGFGGPVTGINITNVTAYSNEVGFVLENVTYSILQWNNASNNFGSGYIISAGAIYGTAGGGVGSFNNLTDNLAYNNTKYGFEIRDDHTYLARNNATMNANSGYYITGTGLEMSYNSSMYNVLINNSAFNNTESGFELNSVDYTDLTGNIAELNAANGFFIYDNANIVGSNNLTNNTAYSNFGGIVLQNINDTILEGNLLYNNTYDFAASENAERPMTYTATDLIITNPSGSLQNFTNLSISDTLNLETYVMIWSAGQGTVPTDRITFKDKYVNISTLDGTPSIDNISFQWRTDELTGFSESKLELWKFNESGWSNESTSILDTTNNRIYEENLVPGSDYGLFQNNENVNCPVISEPGEFIQTQNYVGAPHGSGVVVDYICVVINVSDVTYDCNGYNITNDNRSRFTAGIDADEALTNITIRNCPSILDYSIGVAVVASNSLVKNVTAINSSAHGFYFHGADSLIEDSTAFKSNLSGFMITLSSNVTVRNCTAYNGSEVGFNLVETTGSTLVDNIAYNHGETGGTDGTGFALDALSPNNNLTNNIAHHNVAGASSDGFGFNILSSDNVLENDTAYNDTYGFYIAEQNNYISHGKSYYGAMGYLISFLGTNTTIRDSMAYNNSLSGFNFDGSDSNTIINNSADFNENGGIYLSYVMDSVINDNRVSRNDLAGIYLISSSQNNLSGNTATNSGYTGDAPGFYIYNSPSNTFINNSAASSGNAGFQISASSDNIFTNNSATDDGDGGFYIDTGSSYNNFTGNSINEWSSQAVLIDSSDHNRFTGNTFANCTGTDSKSMRIWNSTGTTLNGDHFYNNSVDIDLNLPSPFIGQFNFTNVIFDNPLGNFNDFTNLSMGEILVSGEHIAIHWSVNDSALPTNYNSFRNKFVNISSLSGITGIDKLVWHWTNAESAGHDETQFSVWHDNGTWSETNATLDTVANTLTLENWYHFSDFGILEENLLGNCPDINAGGSYVLTQNQVGAQNIPSPLTNYSCVNINADDVTIDCNGFNITGGVHNSGNVTYGIFIGCGVNNTKIMNCPGISNYSYGIYVCQSNYTNISNVEVFNNSIDGIFIDDSDYVTMQNVKSHDNGNIGLYVQGGTYNKFSGLNSSKNNNKGIEIIQSDYLDLINSYSENNQGEGLVVNNTFNFNSSNNKYASNRAGAIFEGASQATVTNDKFLANRDDGIIVLSSAVFDLINANSSDNGGSGIEVIDTFDYNGQNNKFIHNTAGAIFNGDDESLEYDPVFSTNTEEGVELLHMEIFDITGGSSVDNGLGGIKIVNSTSVTLQHISISGNAGGLSAEDGTTMTATGLTFSDNSNLDFVVDGTVNPVTYTLNQSVFVNSAGRIVNMTVVHSNTAEKYAMFGNIPETSLPAGMTNFPANGGMLNITLMVGVPTIPIVSFNYRTADIGGFDMNTVKVFKTNDSATWTDMSSIFLNSANAFVATNLNSFSQYGPFGNASAYAQGMTGANVTAGNQTRWSGMNASNVTTEGGNVTDLGINMTAVTDRWAAFYGNVTGTLALKEAGYPTYAVYQWNWSAVDNGGFVCVAENPTYNFLTIDGATPAELDTAWGFGSFSDSALNTFNNGSCTVNLAASTATSTQRAKTGLDNPDDPFATCPMKSPTGTTISPGDQLKFAFCSPIMGASGFNWKNESINFEMIVPTHAETGDVLTTYYFFAQLY